MMRIFTVIGFVLLFSSLGAQKPIEIRSLVDSTHIPYSHICIETGENKEYLASDGHGKALVDIHVGSIVSISAVGYLPLIDTIDKVQSAYEFWLEEKVFTTDAIVITGQYKAVSKDKSIYNIKVIDSKQIELTAANDLGELLSHELNVQINNDPSTGSSIQLQGISGENIKILIDGVPIIGRLDGNIDLSQINLDEVDHIEIVEGPMSVSYGSNALGGVINIITKENRYATFSYGLRSYNESVGQFNQSTQIQVRKKNHNLALNGGRRFFGGYSLNDSLRSQTWKPKEQYNAGGHYMYSNENFKLKNKADFFKESLWNKGNLVGPYYEKAYDNWFYTNRFTNNLTINHRFDTVKTFDFTGAYSFFQRRGLRYIKDLTTLENILTDNPADHDTSTFHAITARGVFARSHKDLNFSGQVGFDINYEIGLGKRLKNTRDEIGDFAVFSSIQWRITEGLLVQPALRYSYNTKYESPLAPSFNLKYKYKKSSFRFSYARGFRAPSLKELNLYFFDSNHQIEGNEDLDAERSHSFNAFYGLSTKLYRKVIELQVKAFHNNIQDMIALVQVDPDNALHYRNENIGEFKNIGSELNITFLPSRFIKVNGGVSYIGSKDDQIEADDYQFSMNANAGMQWNFWKNRWSVAAYYKYMGRSPQYYINSDSEVALGFTDPYHNLDVNLNARFVNNKYMFSLGAKNLFDNTTVAGLGSSGSHSGGSSQLVGWGRTYFVSFAYKFVKY
jgi:outer membrane receptor for ferrienterochelin and colicins